MAHTEFFVTKGSAVADVNGGGPNLGTNDGPVATYANVDATDNGLGDHNLDNNNGGAGWGATQVGDWICYDTAAAKEYAIVVALSVGADPDVINVLTSDGASLTDLTAVNVNVGGAWAAIDHGTSTITTGFVNAAGDPPAQYVKYSATSYAECVTFDNSFTYDVPFLVEGYETTAGDGCPNGNYPDVDGTGQGGNGVFFASGKNYISIKNFYAHSTTAGMLGIYFATSYNGVIENVKVSVGASAIGFYIFYAGFRLVNCWCAASGGHGFHFYQANGAFGCRSDNAGGYGFYSQNVYNDFCHCIANTPNDDGFYVTGLGMTMVGCATYNSTTGSGVRLDDTAGGYQPAIVNCVFEGNNQYGIESDVLYAGYENWNGFYNNAQGNRLNVLTSGPDDVEQSAGSFFTNAAGGDFSLNDTAGRGALLRNAGFPGTLIDGVNIGYADIGALRHEDPAGGGGGLLVHPGMSGGPRG